MDLELDDIKKDWKRATKGLASWRKQAREDYDFAASHQWDADDVAKLEEQERPPVTFDRIGVFVDAVCGMEINNRQAIKYYPVEPGDIKVNDALSQVVKYYENDCGAEDEDSEAARDAVICGIGVTETVMDSDRNPDGAPTVIRRDPLSVWFDQDASRRNLIDRRFFFHGDWMQRQEAEDRWPDGGFSGEMPGDAQGNTAHLADRAFLYREDAQSDDQREGQVFILHYQCWKKEEVYRLRDPQSGQVIDFSKTKFKVAENLFAAQFGVEPAEGRDYFRTTKKIYYRAFLSGNEILEQERLPVQNFTFEFITFKRDRNKRCWYGMVRSMKDPQRWANKWLSQILHIVNTNAKGGAYAEVGAFQDPRRAEELWAQANPLVLLKEGGIEKIKERGQAQYPAGLDKLMQFAFNALPMVSGMNLEAIGLADREQAGVLESQRRQSAYSLLAPLFAALREYRKARGRLMLAFLKFIPEGTLVRITGQRGEQWAPLAHDNLTYDVKVDQAPDSPDYKKQVWDALAQILPAMMKAGYPIPPEVLTFSPLPTDISEQWVQWIKQQGWMPPEQKQQMQKMGEQLKMLGSENMQLKEENMMMRLDHSTEVQKLSIKQQDGEERNAVKVYQAQLNAMNSKIEAHLTAQKNQMQAIIEAEKIALEERMRAMEVTSRDRLQSAQTTIKAFEAIVKSHGEAAKAQSERKAKPMRVEKLEEGVYRMTPENG